MYRTNRWDHTSFHLVINTKLTHRVSILSIREQTLALSENFFFWYARHADNLRYVSSALALLYTGLIFLMIQCSKKQALVCQLLFHSNTSGTSSIRICLLTFILEHVSVFGSTLLINLRYDRIVQMVAIFCGFFRRDSSKLNSTFGLINLLHGFLIELTNNLISVRSFFL